MANVGKKIGGALGGALGGAATGVALGAKLGSVVPGIGTAIGAVAGGLASLLGGGGEPQQTMEINPVQGPQNQGIQDIQVPQTQRRQVPIGMAGGGKVPGRAKMPGNHPANDTVLTALSPGEIVVPRTHATDPQSAARFAAEQAISNSFNDATGIEGIRQSLANLFGATPMYQGGRVPSPKKEQPGNSGGGTQTGVSEQDAKILAGSFQNHESNKNVLEKLSSLFGAQPMYMGGRVQPMFNGGLIGTPGVNAPAYDQISEMGDGSPLLGLLRSPALTELLQNKTAEQNPSQLEQGPDLQKLRGQYNAEIQAIKDKRTAAAKTNKEPAKEEPAKEEPAAEVAKKAADDSSNVLFLSPGQWQAIGVGTSILASLFQERPREQMQVSQRPSGPQQVNLSNIAMPAQRRRS